jgi:Lon protease-like protein
MFPLSAVLFPEAELHLHIFETRYRALVDDCLAAEGEFGVVLIARGSEVGGGDERFAVGTLAHIDAAGRFDDGRWAVVATGKKRIAVARWLADAPYPVAEVTAMDERSGPPGGGVEGEPAGFERARTAVRRVRTLLSELGSPAPVVADLGDPTDGDEAARVWRLCQMAPLTALDGQRLLEADDVASRLTLLSELCEALAGDLLLLLGAGPGPGAP